MESQDLIAFRIALRDLHGMTPANDRRREIRYTPTGPLSQAKVHLAAVPQALQADVVDLSPSGMRLAVEPGVHCAEGDLCTIRMALHTARTLELHGQVRWVKHHPFITVFGVLLEPEHTPIQPV